MMEIYHYCRSRLAYIWTFVRVWQRTRHAVAVDFILGDLPWLKRERCAWVYVRTMYRTLWVAVRAGRDPDTVWPEVIRTATRAQFEAAGLHRGPSS